MKGLGYVRDRAKLPHETPDRVAYSSAPIPPSHSNASLVLDILDQGTLGSCTANAVAQAVRASMVRQGVQAPPIMSRLFAYYLARAYDGRTDVDEGTQIRNVFRAIAHNGFPPESAWPYSDSSSMGAPFARTPSHEAFREAFDQRAPTDYRRIAEVGTARIDAVKRALVDGYLVVFGTLVSDDFCRGLESGVIRPPVSKPIAGGHALTIDGYDGDAFSIVNSWGIHFGNAGRCTFAADYLAWEQSGDFWIVEVSPAFSGAP